MSDEFKNDIVNVNYVAGEQVTATKLEAVADQLRLAIQRLGSSVGDVLTQQTHAATLGAYSLADLSTAGPNLNRLVGSTGWLNPGIFGRTEVTKVVQFVGHNSINSDPPTVNGYSHFNRREFKLPHPPIIFTSSEGDGVVALSYSYTLGASYWSLSGGEAPTTRVTNLVDLDAAGEYHVSPDGLITLYTPLDDGDTFTVTYKFHPVPDAYDGASLNVIPDFEQTATLCTVAVVSPSIYSVTLPTCTAKRSYASLSAWVPPDQTLTYDNSVARQHPNLNQQLLLPVILRDALSTGDIIPDGFIRLWDDTTGTVVEGLEFTYESTSQVNCTGADLTASSDRYRVIVSGTNLARTVYSLRENSRWHDHSGRVLSPSGTYMGSRIHHYDLLNLIDEGDGGTISPGFTVSEIGPTRNPHPMYLHRYGWEYNNAWSDAGNFHNAFMGDLVIGNVDGGLGDSADSFSIYFNDGSPSDSAEIKYDQADNRLEINGSDVYIDRDLLLNDNLLIDGGYIETFGGELYTDGGNVETEDPNSAGNGGSILTDGGLIDTGVTTGTGGTIKSGGGVIDSEGGNLVTTDPNTAGSGGAIITDGGGISTADVSADGSGGNIHTGSGGDTGSNGGYIQTHGGIVDTDGGHIYVNDGEFRYGSLNKKTQQMSIGAAHAKGNSSEWIFDSGLTTLARSQWTYSSAGNANEGLIFPIHLPEESEITYAAVKCYLPNITSLTLNLVTTDMEFGSPATAPGVRSSLGNDTASNSSGAGVYAVAQADLSSSPHSVDNDLIYEVFLNTTTVGVIVYAVEIIYLVDQVRAGVH